MGAVQDKVGKQLLRASRSVAGAAVRGDQGWRTLEERREAKKLENSWLEGLEDSGLIKIREAEGCWKCWMVGGVWGVTEKICDHRRGPS